MLYMAVGKVLGCANDSTGCANTLPTRPANLEKVDFPVQFSSVDRNEALSKAFVLFRLKQKAFVHKQ